MTKACAAARIGLGAAALDCLMETDASAKVVRTRALAAAWAAGSVELSFADPEPRPVPAPGRPPELSLVDPRDVPRRRLGTPAGRIALLHAVAHIEFNAINLALDAAYRFRGMPRRYYDDWLSVADDEARHFVMLRERLQALDADYGDLPAHDGLWQMAVQTADDGLLRMALVPRVLEARGLDVTPGMIDRVRDAGDAETVAVLEVILREEVRHVAIGTRWFHWFCEQRDLCPQQTFIRLIREHYGGKIRPPINEPARLAGGFDPSELEQLQEMISAP